MRDDELEMLSLFILSVNKMPGEEKKKQQDTTHEFKQEWEMS